MSPDQKLAAFFIAGFAVLYLMVLLTTRKPKGASKCIPSNWVSHSSGGDAAQIASDTAVCALSVDTTVHH